MAIKGLALKGETLIGQTFAEKRPGRHLITSAVEHPAVMEVCRYLAAHHFECYLCTRRFIWPGRSGRYTQGHQTGNNPDHDHGMPIMKWGRFNDCGDCSPGASSQYPDAY